MTDPRTILDRCEELEKRLAAPDAAADPEQWQQRMREYSELQPLRETARGLLAARRDGDEARALLEDPSTEPEMRALAEEELERAREEEERLSRQLRLALLPADPRDGRPAIVEIRAGTGGEEAALFAGSLFRMYRMYAERRRWSLTVLSENRTELGGVKEIVFLLEGDAPFSRMKYESGVHRVQRVPETETQGRIHTSAATVAVLPEAGEVDVDIDPGDLRIDTFRSGGAGGQHINKTESAIRITHLPTGLVVECQDERSQYRNKEKAMRVLRSRLKELAERERDEKIAGERRSQVGSGDRSGKIRTYNFPQGRVTDHRAGLTLHRIDAVMDGDLDPLIDALREKEREKQLEESGG